MPTKVHTYTPTDKTKLPPLAMRKPPRQFYLNRPGARELHRGCAHAHPPSRQKNPKRFYSNCPGPRRLLLGS